MNEKGSLDLQAAFFVVKKGPATQLRAPDRNNQLISEIQMLF